MPQNNTCKYNIKTLEDVAKLLENNTITATFAVGQVPIAVQCLQICDLIVGTGNPDIAGIGLFIHYCIQAVLTALFGSWILLFKKTISKKHSSLFATLVKLQRIFVDFNAFAVIVITVSCFVRVNQRPSLYEIIILPVILDFETWMLMLNLIVCVSHRDPDSKSLKVNIALYLLFLAFSAVANEIATMGFVYGALNNVKSSGFAVDLGQIIQYCGSTHYEVLIYSIQRNFLNWNIYTWLAPLFGCAALVLSQFKRLRSWFMSLTGYIHRHCPRLRLEEHVQKSAWVIEVVFYTVSIILIVGFLGTEWYLDIIAPVVSVSISVGIYACDQLLVKGGSIHRSLTDQPPVNGKLSSCWLHIVKFVRTARPVLWLIPSAFYFVANPVLHLQAIERSRSTLNQSLNGISDESSWGVGQVAAIITWLPLLVEAMKELGSFFLPQSSQSANEQSSSSTKSTHEKDSLPNSDPSERSRSMDTSWSIADPVPTSKKAEVVTDVVDEDDPTQSTHLSGSRPSPSRLAEASTKQATVNNFFSSNQLSDSECSVKTTQDHDSNSTTTSTPRSNTSPASESRLQSRPTLAMEEGLLDPS